MVVGANGPRERDEIDAHIAEARVRARDAVGSAVQALETLDALLAQRQKVMRRPADLDDAQRLERATLGRRLDARLEHEVPQDLRRLRMRDRRLHADAHENSRCKGFTSGCSRAPMPV